MKSSEVRAELAVKRIELDQALEAGRPQEEVMRIYKELKELQFEIVQEQMSEQTEKLAPDAHRTGR